MEDPQSITPEWNVLSNPIGDTTTSWTVSNTAATIVSQTNIDRLIPKYDTSCMKLSTAAVATGTVAQTVSSMSITAAQAARKAHDLRNVGKHS